MLDLRQYTCLGAALRDALDRFSAEVCLIEAERDREKLRLTYSDFKEMALPLARALEDADFDPNDRAAIIMTNQSKWLISAYAIFYCGGVLVPLDYKLTAAEHLHLLAHCKAKVLVVEYHLWRAMMQSPDFHAISTRIVLVRKRRSESIWRGRSVGRILNGRALPTLSCVKKTMWPALSTPREPAAVPRGASSPMKTIWSSAARL